MLDAPPPEPVIVVTGRGIEAEERLAATVTLGRGEIERAASGRIEDVLRDIAGLASFRRSDSRSAHPTSQGLTMRGLGGNAASRVTLSLDGVPQADPFGGWIAFTALDPNAIDRVRVTRGGGIEAVAGRIEIDSRSDQSALSGEMSVGSRRSADARGLGAIRWGDGFATIAGNLARGDGFFPVIASDRGAADQRAPYRQSALRARLVQAIAPALEAQLSLALHADRRSRGTDFSDNRQRGRDASLRLVGTGATRWSLVAYVQQRRFDSQFAAVGTGRDSATLTLDQNANASGWGARADVASRWGAIEAKFGAEWRSVTGETEEDFRFVAGSPTRQREAGGHNLIAGLFGGASWNRGGWSIAAEARVDHWRLAGGSLVERNFAGIGLTDLDFEVRRGWQGSGRLALGRSIGDGLTLRGAAYRGWRLPTLNELYRPFRVGADATAANGDLDPERLGGLEAGIDWRTRAGIEVSATAFANRLSRAIANVALGSGPGNFPGVGFVAAGGTYRQRRNVDGIESRGLEVDATWSRGPWRAALSYALTNARLRASGTAAALDGKRPAQVAQHAASGSLGWTDGRFALDATARLAGRRYDDDGNQRELPAALTFDAVARLDVSARLAVEARIENAFDRRVLASIAGDGTRERALPRTWWIGLRLK